MSKEGLERDLQTFYEQMFLIRTVEYKLLELFSQGKIKGTLHTCLGQEACAVGIMNAIDKELDVIFSNHRAHGHMIAYGVPIKPFIAEILGKASGLNRGVGGSQHMHWRNFYTNGIQGGLVPIAVGAALAEKSKKNKSIVLVFLGDGTMGQGIVYEGFNLASQWKLPILFVLEDNKYAQSTPSIAAHAGDLKNRARPFNIPTDAVDGNNVEEVYTRAFEIIRSMRKKNSPFFLVLDTYRLGPHSKGDEIRSQEEMEYHWKNEPLSRIKNRVESGLKEKTEEKIKNQVDEIVSQVVKESSISLEAFLHREQNG